MEDRIHQPILLEAVFEQLQPAPGQTYLDLTAGYGGHAAAIKSKLGSGGKVVLVDRDRESIAYLKQRFGAEAAIMQSDFAAAAAALLEQSFQADMILMDLGISSAQIDRPERGFSFRVPGPLDMRMDQGQKLSAHDIVNRYSETELANLIYTLGEERFSRRIARAIVARRPLTGTQQLADIVSRQVKGKWRLHPATRTFQALRIAVNDEFTQINTTLPRLIDLLRPGGRLGIISFHSLEDRLIKQFIKSTPELTTLHKKVIKGSERDASNRRARSAKLRTAMKK